MLFVALFTNEKKRNRHNRYCCVVAE